MSEEEFVEAVLTITQHDTGASRRANLRALHKKLREELAYELSQWVDKHSSKAVTTADQ
ncbi:MAG TPA: hypothetical protein VM574_07925 [Terrimicrobiaceae bacterium]|jgi:hypothetical protein|nr:hypothetical protein [Terrimicrobiaceae bacterium]